MSYKLLFGSLSFLFLYGFFHSLHLKKMQSKVNFIHSQVVEMQSKVAALQKKTAEAHLLLESKEDPATLELMLMQNLGLVPQGSRRVYFKQ